MKVSKDDLYRDSVENSRWAVILSVVLFILLSIRILAVYGWDWERVAIAGFSVAACTLIYLGIEWLSYFFDDGYRDTTGLGL
jgi:hypothetical protein